MALSRALCESMAEEGKLRRIGNGYQFIGPIDLGKLATVEESYSVAFNARYQERKRKEEEADRKWEREGPWYFNFSRN